MLSSMAFTQSDLTAIETAIKSGTMTVHYRDRSVTYRSLSELLQIKSLIESDIAKTANGGTSMYPRYQVARFSDE